jgi:hypothetical protein
MLTVHPFIQIFNQYILTCHSRESQGSIPNNVFNIPELDALFSSPTPPIIEFVSPPPSHHPSGAGKTSLLYLAIAHAVLPATLSNIPLGGHNASIILFDPLHHFSVTRLAAVMLTILASKTASETTQADLKTAVSLSLLHVHIFRPQSWPSLISTLRSLPEYLFDSTRHKSTNCRIHSIVIDDIDAFIWSIRNVTVSSAAATNPISSASALLTTALQRLTMQFSCSLILASQSTTSSSYRPALPTSWPPNMIVTRFAIRRVEVLRFAPALSVAEAEVERAQRWDVVQKGRFEVWKVGVGVGDGEGFVFRVGETGVEVEREGVPVQS